MRFTCIQPIYWNANTFAKLRTVSQSAYICKLNIGKLHRPNEKRKEKKKNEFLLSHVWFYGNKISSSCLALEDIHTLFHSINKKSVDFLIHGKYSAFIWVSHFMATLWRANGSSIASHPPHPCSADENQFDFWHCFAIPFHFTVDCSTFPISIVVQIYHNTHAPTTCSIYYKKISNESE